MYISQSINFPRNKFRSINNFLLHSILRPASFKFILYNVKSLFHSFFTYINDINAGTMKILFIGNYFLLELLYVL